MLLQVEQIEKTFKEGGLRPLEILRGVSFFCNTGEHIGIVGASGSGKSTLLHILGGLDLPKKGRVLLNGSDLYQQTDEERSDKRNRQIGFVFQFYHLLPELTALDNVMLPRLIAGEKKNEARQKAAARLEQVRLTEFLDYLPSRLSGGQQQRVAIARALVMDPPLILADEPTGNLDAASGEEILELLLQSAGKNRALILVTHNEQLLKRLDRSFRLEKGILHPHEI